MVERSLYQSVSNQDIIDDAMIDRYYDLLRYPGNRAATLARASAERTTASAETMAQIMTPTLLIWGDEDQLVPLEVGQWFDEAISDSVLVRYPGTGHIPMEETPDQSAADMRAWLQSIYPEAPAELAD